MNVSAVSTNPSDLTQRYADFNALQSALQSGNLTSAQHAFAAFEQEIQQAQTAGASSLFAAGTQPGKDLQRLSSALKAADLAGAQTAFASLKQDVQMAGPSDGVPSVGHVHPHRNLTHAAIAANGVQAFGANVSGGVAATLGSILNFKA
jgi:hypothetical protein